VGQESLENESDGQLIRRFAKARDERAFAMLVERRGALVAGACARMLPNRADAEDAFQAVFWVLARRAAALGRSVSLAGWLHAVAVRVCLNDRKMERRRQRRMQEAAKTTQESTQPQRLDELKLVIDEELAALPQRLREVVVLCDLEGCSREEVARTLSLPLGTVSSRLARGREVMRKRLVHHGWSIAVGGVTAFLAQCGQAAPPVSNLLVSTTAQNAHIFLFGTAAAKAALGTKIISLAEGVLYAMIVNRWKVAASLVLLLAITLFGSTLSSSFVPGLIGTASAATVFFDDFEDGSATDGNPVLWVPGNGASLAVENGSLVVSGTTNPFALASDVTLSNTSLRTQVRLLEGSYLVVGLRNNPPANPNGYYVSLATPNIVVPNEASIFTAGNNVTELALTNHNLDLTQDVVIQFDAIGNRLSFYAWQAGGPVSQTPLLSVTDNQIAAGRVSLLVTAGATVSAPARAAFRYVHVANMPIPEPQAATLAAAGAGLLAFTLPFGRRRFWHTARWC
jgi:RNA polymerase sigma factor (sigma-70 family)